MGAKRTIKHTIDGGIIEHKTEGLSGSRHLLEISYGSRIANLLLDLGGNEMKSNQIKSNQMNHSSPEFFDPLRNIHPESLHGAIISHVHQDHNGDIVHLTKGDTNKKGYSGNIFMTNMSKNLCEILTRDNLKVQSEEKSAINKRLKDEWDNIRKAVDTIKTHHGTKNTRHKKINSQKVMDFDKAVEILENHNIDIKKINSLKYLEDHKPTFKSRQFNENDIKILLEHIQAINYHHEFNIVKDFVKAKFYDAGHVEGSAQVLLKVIGNIHRPKDTFNILYTGDLGRIKQPGLSGQPEIPKEKIDYLIIESTYGDRIHPDRILEEKRFLEELNTTKGLAIIPCFTIQRLQEIAHLINNAVRERILKMRANEYIHIDSNLGYDITKEFIFNNPGSYNTDNPGRYDTLRPSNPRIKWIDNLNDTQDLLNAKGRRILVCSGGMLENGSVMKYLHKITQQQNAKILTTGFQAPGTIGYKLSHNDFSTPITVNDKTINYNRASIHNFSFSGHADQEELIDYISKLKLADNVEIALVHGGDQRIPLAKKITALLQQHDLRKRVNHRGQWQIHIPEKNGTQVTVKELK